MLGVLNWAMHNAGQDCGAIERVYVVESIAGPFVERLADAARRLEIAPLANARQLATVEAHVADALAKGAVLLAGGKRVGTGLGYAPTVLDRCTHEMKVVTDETFGPVVAVLRVRDAEQAIAQANDSTYGLNASVWTRDRARGEAIARRLEAGTSSSTTTRCPARCRSRRGPA